MLESMNEEPLLPTTGISDKYKDFSSAAHSVKDPVNSIRNIQTYSTIPFMQTTMDRNGDNMDTNINTNAYK